jgi:hypothetical protein
MEQQKNREIENRQGVFLMRNSTNSGLFSFDGRARCFRKVVKRMERQEGKKTVTNIKCWSFSRLSINFSYFYMWVGQVINQLSALPLITLALSSSYSPVFDDNDGKIHYPSDKLVMCWSWIVSDCNQREIYGPYFGRFIMPNPADKSCGTMEIKIYWYFRPEISFQSFNWIRNW